MNPPSLPPQFNSSSQASAAWPPIPNSTGSAPPWILFTRGQPPPTTLLTKAKRNDAQCRIPVTTWPGIGLSSSTVTVELPCTSTPWNIAGTPISEGSPQQPAVATAVTPTTVNMVQQPGATTQQGSSASSTSPASILHMDEGGVAAIISVLSVAVLGAGIGCYFWGRKMGMIKWRRANQNAAQGLQPHLHGQGQ